MTQPIAGIRPPSAIEASSPASSVGSAPGAFQEVFASALGEVRKAGQASQTGAEQFLSGENEEVHQVVLATQRAELSFDLFLQMRNKVVQAYQEVMRMQM